MSINSFLTYFS